MSHHRLPFLSRTHQKKKKLKPTTSYYKQSSRNTVLNCIILLVCSTLHVIFIPCSWLEHLRHVLCTELQGSEAISWAAYHAQSQQEVLPDGNTALSALLPLFHDEAKSVAMIRLVANFSAKLPVLFFFLLLPLQPT